MKKILNIVTKTPTIITVFLGIFLLFFQIFTGQLSQKFQIVFFAFLILTAGIPHGALDHLIQKQTYSKLKIKYSFVKFLVKYLAIMAFYGMLWYWFTGFSFLFFILISAWHFGETDIDGVPKNNIIWYVVRLVYGLYVLAFILLIHHEEASPIVRQMLGNEPDILLIWAYIQENVKAILYLLGLFLITFFMVAQSQHFINFDKFRFVRLAIILFLTIWLPLIPAFALYFGGWHALCAFDNTYDFLRKDHPKISFKYVYFNSMPFTILAILFLTAFLWFCQNYTNRIDPFAILFIFISLITLPHLIITNEMAQVK
jgi:beta-carotene 15,15'-dioxygenase